MFPARISARVTNVSNHEAWPQTITRSALCRSAKSVPRWSQARRRTEDRKPRHQRRAADDEHRIPRAALGAPQPRCSIDHRSCRAARPARQPWFEVVLVPIAPGNDPHMCRERLAEGQRSYVIVMPGAPHFRPLRKEPACVRRSRGGHKTPASCIMLSRNSDGRRAPSMRLPLIGIMAAMAAIISPVWAQAPPRGTYPPQWPSATYSGSTYQPYLLLAPTPRDAHRDGTINRWQLEQLELG